MGNKYILFVIFTGICLAAVYCQTSKLVKYKLSGRNMLEYKNLFFEVVNDLDSYCRSESISGTDNPEWGTECWVTFSGDTSQYLSVDFRNDIPLSPDESIGWGFVHVKNMLEQGETIQASICRDDGNAYRGYISIFSEQVRESGEINRRTNTTFRI